MSPGTTSPATSSAPTTPTPTATPRSSCAPRGLAPAWPTCLSPSAPSCVLGLNGLCTGRWAGQAQLRRRLAWCHLGLASIFGPRAAPHTHRTQPKTPTTHPHTPSRAARAQAAHHQVGDAGPAAARARVLPARHTGALQVGARRFVRACLAGPFTSRLRWLHLPTPQCRAFEGSEWTAMSGNLSSWETPMPPPRQPDPAAPSALWA